MHKRLDHLHGSWPQAVKYSFPDRVRQQTVQLTRPDMLNPLPENLRNPPDLCALAVTQTMEKYTDLLRSDLEETVRLGTVPRGALVNFPTGPRPTPPPLNQIQQPAPQQFIEPGDWVGGSGKKRKSKKRKSKKRKSKKRKSKKGKSLK